MQIHRDSGAPGKTRKRGFGLSRPLGLGGSSLLVASAAIAFAQAPATAPSADQAWRDAQQTIANGPGDL